MVHSIDYEIVLEYKCKQCGDSFDDVDENNLCEVCAEYERTSIEE